MESLQRGHDFCNNKTQAQQQEELKQEKSNTQGTDKIKMNHKHYYLLMKLAIDKGRIVESTRLNQ